MMGRQTVDQSQLFYLFNLEEYIPADHLLRRLNPIVSRVLVGRQTGTVTLFAFDEGQGLSEHTAPFDALVQVFDAERIAEGLGQFLELQHLPRIRLLKLAQG